MATCYSSFDVGPSRHCTPAPHKDYSRPLHVDCSVEYELPNQAKPPEGARSEPLLMIHPCYYRRAESQRRSPFINNLPTPRGVVSTSRRSQQQTWNPQQLEPPPPQPVVQYSKPAGGAKHGKRDPLLCGGDFSSGSDSGVSAGHWTDSDRSPLAPEVRLQRDFHNNNNNHAGTDSGITTPVSLADDKTVLSELLAATAVEVNNNNSKQQQQQQQCQQCQPAVGVAAVAPACTSCRPGFLQPAYQRILQQPWPAASHYQQPALTAAVPVKHRRAVEPGPEHAAHHVHVRRSAVPWARSSGVKRSRTQDTSWVYPAETTIKEPVCKACCQTAVVEPQPPQQQPPQWGSYYGVTGHCRGASEDGSRILWNNENMLRLFQV